jgi:hypothetical protein
MPGRDTGIGYYVGETLHLSRTQADNQPSDSARTEVISSESRVSHPFSPGARTDEQ